MKTASKLSIQRLDRTGMAVSVVRAIHCAIMPLILGSLAAAGVSWPYNEAVAWTILAASVAIGTAGLHPAYRARHRKNRCLGLFPVRRSQHPARATVSVLLRPPNRNVAGSPSDTETIGWSKSRSFLS